MKLRMYLSAFFNMGNISMLMGMLLLLLIEGGISSENMAGAHVTGLPVGPLAYLAVFVIYTSLVGRTLYSKKFHESFMRREKLFHIRQLNANSSRLANEARKYTNAAYFRKLQKVMENKNEIIKSFFREEHSPLKERIVEQAMILIVSYLKLLTNFCIRSRDLSTADISQIAERMNNNHRRLSFARDANDLEDIKRAIEMDERLVARLKEEKSDLEGIKVKLDYIESTVNLLKQRVLSSIESEEMLGRLQEEVNEAEALDNVLQERRKNRHRA